MTKIEWRPFQTEQALSVPSYQHGTTKSRNPANPLIQQKKKNPASPLVNNLGTRFFLRIWLEILRLLNKNDKVRVPSQQHGTTKSRNPANPLFHFPAQFIFPPTSRLLSFSLLKIHFSFIFFIGRMEKWKKINK